MLVKLLDGKLFIYSYAIENKNYLLLLFIKTTNALGDTEVNKALFINTKFKKRLIY